MRKLITLLLSAARRFLLAVWREITGENETVIPPPSPRIGAPPGFKPVRWDESPQEGDPNR